MSMTLNEGSYTQAEQARGTGAPPQRRDGLVRCAIYTRKSTDEGLDQDFNSLDAQRESAEAYILRHKHEGWVCLPTSEVPIRRTALSACSAIWMPLSSRGSRGNWNVNRCERRKSRH